MPASRSPALHRHHPTIASGGTLIIGAGGGDGINPSTKSLVVPSGALLKYTGANRVQNDTVIDVKSGGIFDENGQTDSIGYINGAGAITNMNGALTLTGPAVGSGSDFSGTITGTGIISFIANGTGASSASTFTLSSANDIGGVSVTGGRVIARNTGAFGNAGKTVTVGAAALTLAPTVEFATDTTVNKYILNAGSGNTGTFVLNRATSGATVTHEVGVATFGNATLNFEKGANVTGTPILQFDGISATAGFAGTMLLNPTTVDIKVLSSGSVSIGSGNNAKGINLGGTSTGNEIAAPISNGLNTLSITKSNTSTWTLGGTNTYTGATTVLSGTLNLNGSIGASSAVTVGGATATGTPILTGTGGTVNGTLNIAAAGGGAAGTVNPGTAGTLGTLNAGATTIGGTYGCDVTAVGTDLLTVAGNLDITGATLALNVIANPPAGSYNIATYTGTLTGTFSPTPALPSGFTIDYSTPNVIKLTVSTATPYETWGLPYGLTAGTGGGDLDNDGLTNFQEFAFGLIPDSGSSVNPITSQLNKTTGQFTYQRLAASG